MRMYWIAFYDVSTYIQFRCLVYQSRPASNFLSKKNKHFCNFGPDPQNYLGSCQEWPQLGGPPAHIPADHCCKPLKGLQVCLRVIFFHHSRHSKAFSAAAYSHLSLCQLLGHALLSGKQDTMCLHFPGCGLHRFLQ